MKNELKLFVIESLVFIGVVLFIVITPNNDYFSFDNKRIFEVGLIFINLLILFDKNFRGRLTSCFYLFSLQTRTGLVFILLLAVVSAIFAPLARNAFLEVSLFLGLYLISLTIFCLLQKNQLFFNRILVLSLITSSVLYQTTFFSLYLSALIHNIPVVWPLPFSGFSNIRFFNQYHLWLFFLLSYPLLAFGDLDNRLRKTVKLIAIGWSILLFYSASRGAVIAILLGLLITGFAFKRQAVGFIKLNLWILLYGLIGTWGLFKLLPLVLAKYVIPAGRSLQQLTTDSPRLYLCRLALSHIREHPWLGIGPMHYAYYPNPISSYYPNPIFAHPHNSVLQWAAEMGLPSAIIMTILVVHGLRLWVVRFNNHAQDPAQVCEEVSLAIILFATLCTTLIYSLVDGVIVMPTSQLLMATMVGWMFGLYFQPDNASLPRVVKSHLFVLVFAGLHLIVLTYTVIPDLIPRLAGEKNISSRNHPKVMDPRFWAQGHIPD